MDTKETIKKIEEEFGSRMAFIGHQIIRHSRTGEPGDITFLNKKPAIGVKIDKKINKFLKSGASPQKIKEMLENIELSNSDVINIEEIWTINPMPSRGFSKEELLAVDISEPEQDDEVNGATLRKIISDTYHCESQEEEDLYLRRFIAST